MIRQILSDETMNRKGYITLNDGVNWDEYRKNPVLMLEHEDDKQPIAAEADYPVEVITGPEFVTGSTRMKAGTSQKLIFDMISTTVQIRLGRVEGNKMVNAKLMNTKLIDRAVRIFMERNPQYTNYEEAKNIVLKAGSVKKAEEQKR